MYDRQNSTFIIMVVIAATITFATIVMIFLVRTNGLDDRITVIEQKLRINQRQ